MAYEQLPYEPADCVLPAAAAAWIAAAEQRYTEYQASGLHRRFPRYVPSEPAQVYAALKHVSDRGLPLGDCFVEWGSGFGVATGLAALLGYQATGIEIAAQLIGEARTLAARQPIDAEFIHCSYVPEGLVEYETLGTTDLEFDSLGRDTSPSYPGMDLPINEVDLFFAYPWPGEQSMLLKLFDLLAGDGAIFVAYFGDREVNLYRKL